MPVVNLDTDLQNLTIMGNIEIRKASIADIVQLQIIGRQTFYETFAERNTEENMRNYLDKGFSIDKLTVELKNTKSEFYFAKLENKVIGYLKINSGDAQTELQDKNALEIERIYVLKEYQGKKIGQLLYEKALQIAVRAKADYLWLGVWVENQKAINFYRKNGFTEFDRHIFKLGSEKQTDIMMKLKIGWQSDQIM
jgi:diamine N-acetyltransferase